MTGPRLLLLLVLMVPACATASSSPPRPVGSGSRPAASVGRVSCEVGGARVSTPTVRARRDGIHLEFRNPAGMDEFYMWAADDADDNHGGRLRAYRTKDVSSHAPGQMWVACMDRGEPHPPFNEDDSRYARFEIVDPRGLWVAWEPDCSDVEDVESRRVNDAGSLEDVERWVRERFDIEGGSRVRPGYPGTQWKGAPWVIVKERRTLAYFQAYEDDVGWIVQMARGCS